LQTLRLPASDRDSEQDQAGRRRREGLRGKAALELTIETLENLDESDIVVVVTGNGLKGIRPAVQAAGKASLIDPNSEIIRRMKDAIAPTSLETG